MLRDWQRTGFRLLVLSAMFSVAHPSAGDIWDDFHITIDPSSPTDEDTFDLRAFRWFGDSGYLPIDQSIHVSGNQINVWALVQDLHTQPGSVFLTVMTPAGAFFDDYGPLAAGTYDVNAELWLTPWPATSGGYLYDSGSLQFTVTSSGAKATFPGDFNNDNAVDTADYVVWRKDPGATLDDYNDWRGNFGATSGSVGGAGSVAAAPEPSSSALGWLALAALFAMRRWHWRAQ